MHSPKSIIIDSRIGNIYSVYKAIKKIKISCEILDDLKMTDVYNCLFLPGVSSFDSYAKSLQEKYVWNLLKNYSRVSNGESQKSEIILKSFSGESIHRVIGICAGAQILFESSEEGELKGLGLLKGRVQKIIKHRDVKVPHLGWNKIILNHNHPMAHLFDGIDLENKKFYFSHSYRFPDSEATLAYVDYGERFPVVVAQNNIIAIQFHPEKSYGQGLKLLKNICDL